MSAAPGREFPNPCPVCGSTDEHAEFRERSTGMGGSAPSLSVFSPPLLDPEAVRQLLRESVTVVKPGEVLFFTVPEGFTPTHVREIQDLIREWLDYHNLDIKVLVLPHGEMAVAEAPA